MRTVKKQIIKTVLIGRPTESNQTIAGLLKDHRYVEVKHWQPSVLDQKLDRLTEKVIDVAITDMTSITKPILIIKTLAEHDNITAVLAVNNQPSPAIMHAAKLAGAAGYITTDVGEQDLFGALKTLSLGKTFFPEL